MLSLKATRKVNASVPLWLSGSSLICAVRGAVGVSGAETSKACAGAPARSRTSAAMRTSRKAGFLVSRGSKCRVMRRTVL